MLKSIKGENKLIRIKFLFIILFITGIICFSTTRTMSAVMDKTGILWAPFMEWSLDNPTYADNPYDLVATATFVHTASGETRTTQMFYNGGNTWKFRFTGTRIGTWTFMTSSIDTELNGWSGTVIVNSNSDPKVNGFLTSSGNKFAIQDGESGQLKGFLFNVFQHQEKDIGTIGPHIRDSGILRIDANFMNTYLNEARDNGFNVVFFLVMDPNVWMDGTNPRLEVFDKIDLAVTTAHSQGMRVDFWLWGDAERSYTPLGGKMSVEDKRLLRYISARMAPLPGWTMGYGFDLEEWATNEDTQKWAEYMHQHMGWEHLLWARGRFNSELDVNTYSDEHQSYTTAASNIDSDLTRPHHFGERDYYLRTGATMDWTRQSMWKYAMAGGHGGHWGYKGNTNIGSWLYPNAEQLRTHYEFWHTHERFLLNMARADSLTDGYCLKTPDNRNYVFYKESTDFVQMDLTSMNNAQTVVAVDTKLPYKEINLGIFNTTMQTWMAPYSSDWAIAVGDFGVVPIDSSPPTVPQSLNANAESESQIDLTWQASTDAESGITKYMIYRDETKVGESTSTAYTDTEFSLGISYSFEVSAVNGAGLESNKSSSISVITLTDTNPPLITSVSVSNDAFKVYVNFNEPVEQTSAENISNYSIDKGIIISAASLGSDFKTVSLSTFPHDEGITYTLTVNNISDRSIVPNTIADNTQKTYSYVDQLIISNLVVSSGEIYEVALESLTSGETVYIDRSYTYTNVPSSIENTTFIRTANDDKASSGDSFISFDVNQNVTVYVAHDDDISSKPSWFSSFTDTGENLVTSDTTLSIFAKDFPASTIVLGGNKVNEGSGASMYIVIITEQGTVTIPDTMPPSPPIALEIN